MQGRRTPVKARLINRALRGLCLEERRFYEDLLRTQPAGVYRLRISPAVPPDGRVWAAGLAENYTIEFVSDRFCAIAGISREAFQQDPALILTRVHPEERETFARLNAEALQRKQAFRWEGRLVSEGAPRWARFESSPRLLPDGVSLWTGILSDTTEQHLGLEREHRQHQILEGIMEGAGGPVFALDREYRYLSFNAAHAQTMQALYGTEIAVGRSLFDCQTVAEDRARAKANLDRAFTGETFVEEGVSGEAPGAQRWFEVVHIPLRDAGGATTGVAVFARDTTARRAAEVALRESEARHRAVFEASADGLVVLDRDSMAILDANPAFCSLYGYTRVELQGMKATDVSAEPEATQVATQGGAEWVSIRWHRRKDGTVFPVELVAHAFHEHGRVQTIVSIRDITKRLAEEVELRRRVVQLQTLVELGSLPARFAGDELLREGLERIVLMTDSRVGFLHLLLEDQETLQLTAWTAETQRHCTAAFDTHYPLSKAGIWADAARLRQPILHNDFPHAPGQKGMPEGHFPLTRELVVPVVEGDLVRLIAGVGNKDTDYTEVDTAQVELATQALWKAYARQQALQQLRQREATLRATFEQALVGMAQVSLDGRILQVNQRFAHLVGRTVAELEGLSLARITAPEDAFPPGVSLRDLLGSQGEGLVLEKRYLRPDGTVVWVQVVESLVAPEDSEAYLLKVVEDITDRKHMEAEIRALNRGLEQRVAERTRQLEAVNQDLEAFGYSVSHDLRAPLRAITGFTEALHREAEAVLSPVARGHLARIEGNAARMTQLIDDLLKLSRIGREEPLLVATDLGALAERVLQDLQTAFPERTVAWEVDRPLRVLGDPRLLRVLLENLLGNAWKFTARTPEARIRVGTFETDTAMLGVVVRDNGAGFASNQASRLFTPFQRLHRAEDFPGTGIGLAIAKRIVNRHGGEIRADAEPGAGAALSFTLPRPQEAP